MSSSRKRNSAQTIQAILEAAREEFIESGINKAKIETIAERAGVSQQLIYHYFGGKENLYQEMLTDLATLDVTRAKSLSFDDVEPVEALTQFISILFAANHRAGRLVIDQIQQEGKQIIDRNPIRASTAKHIETLTSILERGKAARVFRDDINGEDLFILIWMLSFGLSSFGPMASKYIDRDFVAEINDGYWRDFAINFILNSVATRSR